MAKAKEKTRSSLVIVLILLLIGISVGYAAFAQTLNITGSATANGTFKLKFSESEVDQTTLVGATVGTNTINANGDLLTIAATLNYPGSTATVKATVLNEGSIGAKLDSVTLLASDGVTALNLDNSDIKVTVTGYQIGDKIAANGTKTISVNMSWVATSTATPTNSPVEFKVKLNYSQDT